MWPFSKRANGTPTMSAPDFQYQNEHAILPTQVDTNDPTYPLEPSFVENGPEAWRGTTGDRFQDDYTTADDGTYHLAFRSDPGIVFQPNNSIIPQPGSTDLSMPRDIGGVVGMNRILQSVGPVTGRGTEFYNLRAKIAPQQIGQYGPVVGGGDYAQQLANAYYAQANAIYDQASAEAAMVASI